MMDDNETTQTDGKRGATRVDPITRLCVVRAHAAQPELSCAELAEQHAVSESSVRRILAVSAIDRKSTVQELMLSDAIDIVEAWRTAVAVASLKGYHQPAKEWLEAAQAIDAKPQVQANVNVKPTVHLAMNFGLGALTHYRPAQAPAIEGDAVPALPSKKVDSVD